MADKTLTLDQFRTLRKDNVGGLSHYSSSWYSAGSLFTRPGRLCKTRTISWTVSFAVLLALHLGELHPRQFAADRFMVESFSGFLDLVDSRRFSRHLLLLS